MVLFADRLGPRRPALDPEAEHLRPAARHRAAAHDAAGPSSPSRVPGHRPLAGRPGRRDPRPDGRGPGQAVVANPRVPGVVRNALNVESGLNDGLALPFVTIFLAIGQVASGMEASSGRRDALLALVGSTVIGLVMGVGGGWLVRTRPSGPGGRALDPIALVALAAAPSSSPTRWRPAGSWRSGSRASRPGPWSAATGRRGLPPARQAADALAAVGFLLLGAGLLAPVLARATPDRAVRGPEPHRDPDRARGDRDARGPGSRRRACSTSAGSGPAASRRSCSRARRRRPA